MRSQQLSSVFTLTTSFAKRLGRGAIASWKVLRLAFCVLFPAASLLSTVSPAATFDVEHLFARACEREKAHCADCVDLYFQVAAATAHSQATSCQSTRCAELHADALTKLVELGQHFGRLDPRQNLRVQVGGRWLSVPIQHRGFVWQPTDFEQLHVVGRYRTKELSNRYRCDGAGIPLVVSSSSPGGRALVVRRPHFSATLVMVWNSAAGMGTDGYEQIELHLLDPLRVDSVLADGVSVPIARDTSAWLAFRLNNEQSTILEEFLRPAQVEGDSRLVLIEPFQAGKIPVVFIHGLLSDPLTWAEMINELQATPGFVENFQVAIFDYPTGEPFLFSAARLREQLHLAGQVYGTTSSADFPGERLSVAIQVDSPGGFDHCVLVGHSMGGLVAKMQVSQSGERVWSSIANRPLHQICVSAESRQQLRESFFFEPVPQVSRVIFIGTPHEGSVYARRLVGRIGSALVREPADRERNHEQMIRCNPGVFVPSIQKGIPSSIDLLEPRSELLNAISGLPIRSDVALHSIIGNGRFTLGYGASDGVVPVSSAREPRARTEHYVHEKHGDLNKHPDTVQEVVCLLRQHLSQQRAGYR